MQRNHQHCCHLSLSSSTKTINNNHNNHSEPSCLPQAINQNKEKKCKCDQICKFSECNNCDGVKT